MGSDYIGSLWRFHVNLASSDLTSNAKPLMIQAIESNAQVYYVQKTFLASVSTKLAERCCQQPTKLAISEEALCIFLAWLISRNADEIDELGSSQVSLAQAWNFGAQYDMPGFQDAVMHQLASCLSGDSVSPDAVVVAYATTRRGTKLQSAFIAQLAIDMRRGGAHAWDRTTFTDYRLEEVMGFFLDLTDAMCDAEGNAGIRTNDFLFTPCNDT